MTIASNFSKIIFCFSNERCSSPNDTPPAIVQQQQQQVQSTSNDLSDRSKSYMVKTNDEANQSPSLPPDGKPLLPDKATVNHVENKSEETPMESTNTVDER